MSLHQNKKTLINSNIAPRILPDKEDRESIKQIDDNYILVKIPIGVDVEAIDKEYEDEEVPEDIEDEDELEYYEYYRQLEKWAKKENESYLDYFNEYRRGDNKKSVKFQITNDLGETEFGLMLSAFCDDIDTPKNDLYYFKTNKGHIYDIKFSEEISKVCNSFSGVEYIVTYYNPKRENANVIVDTFIDAISRIVDHLGNLKQIEGTLMIDDGKTELTPIGFLEKNRILFNKPGTNLYYMQTYDSFDTLNEKSGIKLETLLDVVFAPQMTFKCKAGDAIEIMIEMLRPSPENTIGKSSISVQKSRFNNLILIDDITNKLFAKYIEVSGNNINISTGSGKILKTYVFLIIYKMFMFFEGHNKIMDTTDYLKDHLAFNSRHGSYDLYERIKEIFENEFFLSGSIEVQTLLENTQILAPFFIEELKNGSENENYKDDYENGVFKYGDDFYLKDLPETDENYGNPLYSVKSYFRYFESNGNDWLVDSKYDLYSTTFSLDKDEILIENRWFRYAISLYLRNNIDSTVHSDYLSVKDMVKIINKAYPVDKIKKMRNFEWHPIKKKISKKCKKGYYRDLDFECVKTKKQRLLNRLRKTKKATSVAISGI
jgi:hypothetical protein